MLRKIICIDEEKCNGCGACATACHEGAIAMVDGKAKLVRDDFCDGLGDCLPACPADAISFEMREAAPYDEAAVQQAKRQSCCANWPIQIKLAPEYAPYFQNTHLTVAADCTAYAYARFHPEFVAGKVVLVGCPKLDATDYSEKLARIFGNNDFESATLVRMEVPCCGGLEHAVRNALAACGKDVPCRVVTVTIDGRAL